MILARLFVLVGGLVVLALLAALIGPYFIDWTNYRADFEREASAIFGRRVTVEGAAEARLLPFPSLAFTNVSVGGGPDGRPAMTIDRFSMDAELAPFLSGEFLIFDMRVERPQGVLQAAADGTIDWAVRPSAPISAGRIAIEKLTVTDGRIEIRHALSGRTHLLTDINADVSAKSLAGPWRLDGALKADGIATTLSASTGVVEDGGRIRLRVKAAPAGYAFALDADGTVAPKRGGLDYSGEFHLDEVKPKVAAAPGETAAPASPGYRLNGQFGLDNRHLDVVAFRFETGPLDRPYTADGKADIDFGAEPKFSIEAKGAQVKLDEAIGGPQGSSPSLDERIEAVEQAVLGLPKPTMPGSIQVDLPAVLVGDTTIRDVRLSAEPVAGGWAIKSAGATLPGRATLEADGFLGTADGFGFKGSLLLAVAQPSGFAAWLANDIDEAIRRLPSAGFSAKVDVSQRRQTLGDLELILGEARFHGGIDSRQPEGVRPSVSVKLDGGALDAEGLSAFTSLFVSEKGANRFSGSDIDVQVKAGPIAVAGFSAGIVDTALRLRDGRIDIDRLAIGDLAGASISATGALSDFPADPAGNLDASVVALDLAPLVNLANANLPDIPVLQQLQHRVAGYPDLLKDSRLDVVASLATEPDGGSTTTVDLHGDTGGTALSLSGSMKGSPADWRLATVSLAASASNKDATPLLAMAGLQALPLGIVGSGELTLQADGIPADGLQTKLAFDGERLAAAFEGSTGFAEGGPTAKGKASLSTDDIEPWMMTAGIALPGLGNGMPVDLSAQADFGARLLVLEGIEGAVNETAVAGDVNVEIDEGMPHLAGALVVDELALDPLAAIVLGEASLVGDPGVWASTPFTAKAAMPFKAEMDVSSDTLTAGALTAYDATLSLRSDGEGLRVDGLKATYDGGALTGRFDLKNNAGAGLVSGQFQLDGADLTRDAAFAGLSGTGDLSATLSGTGKSVEAIVASLSGSGVASVKGLSVAGINQAALPDLLARADQSGRDIDASRTAAFANEVAKSGAFHGGDAEIAFTIAGGVARAAPVTLGGEPAKLTTDMQVDLNSGAVEAKGRLAYAAGDEALTGSEPSLDFVAAGPLGETQLILDSAPLAQFLSQRALEKEERRVEAMQAVLLEKQRLRREVRYYASLEAERDRIADEARQAEEAARERAAAQAKAEAEAEIRRKAKEEERRRLEAEKAARDEADARARAEAAQTALEEAERSRLAAQARAQEAARELERSATPDTMAPPPQRRSEAAPRVAPAQPEPFTLDTLLPSLDGG